MFNIEWSLRVWIPLIQIFIILYFFNYQFLLHILCLKETINSNIVYRFLYIGLNHKNYNTVSVKIMFYLLNFCWEFWPRYDILWKGRVSSYSCFSPEHLQLDIEIVDDVEPKPMTLEVLSMALRNMIIRIPGINSISTKARKEVVSDMEVNC